jgi:hypothetical protein
MPGLVALFALGIAYDSYAVRTRNTETISSAVWRVRDNSKTGWLFAACTGAALWHFIHDNPRTER